MDRHKKGEKKRTVKRESGDEVVKTWRRGGRKRKVLKYVWTTVIKKGSSEEFVERILLFRAVAISQYDMKKCSLNCDMYFQVNPYISPCGVRETGGGV